ncbi:acyltransferase family protein [Novosphingobium sp. KACC 22771]|uniref:acyltransferase family protein n=1 Tax=Novosphingobium sp. KACC 22771 TaxID=3025670 RepID=UPI0023657912|nr:acyltransferase [Novosphingobium sp. KACC 22771]WDF73577.1 acyltransferase [Novosphingobium sp. KACC 22771]
MSQTTRPAAPVGRLPMLDALRGVAALGVVLHHEAPLYGAPGLFPRAYLAVDFFFMLSGFVLTLAFEPKMRGGMATGDFLVRRVARLWPVLAVGVLIGAGWRLWIGATGQLWLLTLCGLLLVPLRRGPGGLYPINGPQWSLAYELLANAAHALVLARLGNRALLVFVLAGAGMLAWCAYVWGSVGLGDTGRNWWGGFARVGFGYGMGVWLGRKFAAGRAPVGAGLAWAGGLALPLALFSLPWWPLGVVAGDLLAVFVIFPPALWCAAHVVLGGGALKIADGLGRLSYPAYAIHGPVLIWGAWLAHRHGAQAAMIRPLTLVAVLALAALLAISPLAHGIPANWITGRRKG